MILQEADLHEVKGKLSALQAQLNDELKAISESAKVSTKMVYH